VPRGIVLANDLEGDICLLEGSGSAIPPAHADATVLVVPASVPEEFLAGYFGPYRLLLSDLVVVTMAEEPFGSALRVSSLTERIHETLAATEGRGGRRGEVEVVRTVFRPSPTRSVRGADVCVATTAPEAVGDSMKRHLEEQHGCRVVGISHSLSKRTELERDLGTMMKGADILLCEIKAAGIDVATRRAVDAGLDVVYMDNELVGARGDDPAAALTRAARLAMSRFEEGVR
jgi:cyclic 2,3-diphosphoglycerate synthetase